MSGDSCCKSKINDYECKVVAVEPFNEKLFWLTLKCPELASKAEPGNCVMLFAAAGGDPLLGRPFAIADADPGRGEISLCIAQVGRGTRLLAGKLQAEALRLRGPMGIALPRAGRVHLAAGGVGAAIFLLYNKLFRGDVAGFYLGVPGRGYESFAAKVKSLAPNAMIFTDDGSFGDGDSMFAVLPQELGRDEAVWACGPPGFFGAARRHYAASGDKLWLSLEKRMACGYGGCMGCVVETGQGLKRVCVDQALFRADEVNIDEC